MRFLISQQFFTEENGKIDSRGGIILRLLVNSSNRTINMNINIARNKIIKLGKKDQKLRNKFANKNKRNILISFNEVSEFDKISTTFLISVVERFGVPTIPVFGKIATRYAFLIAQHSSNLGFQKKYLNLLKKENPNHIFIRHIAYLEDRVNMYEGKPQKYGTQFTYDSEKSKYVPYKLLNESEVDKYRKEMGLEPIEEYSKNFN